MEQFLLGNVSRYQSLVNEFKPPPKTGKEDVTTSPNLVVAVRIRPMLDKETTSGQVPAVFSRSAESGAADLHEMRRTVKGPPTLNSYCFHVDKVFGADRTTETIYEDIVKPLLPWVLQGRVSTLFAYGQTGSGKTFTVSGLEQLIATSLFDSAKEGQKKIQICIVELAGNSAYDLLNERASISVLEDAFGNTQLMGALEHHITSTSQVLELVDQATAFRQTAATGRNDRSSRSHAICRIRVKDLSPQPVEDGFLYMIDLAGSEAARDVVDHTADRMKETREVNVSLSTLKDCIRAMATLDLASSNGKPSKKPYIPFRQSALTKVLKHLFDPAANHDSKTAIISCINPSFLDVSASKNTLRYAEMLRVAIPKTKPLQPDPYIPTTWTNKDVRSYITLKSGFPMISAHELAPYESGLQFLRLPLDEFVRRSLKTEGVTEEQATAFHAKLWRLHTESQHTLLSAGSSSKGRGRYTDHLSEKFSSSRELDTATSALPFKNRIRPGMVIRWTPPADFPVRLPSQNLALVLCPHHAVEPHVRDILGNQVNPELQGGEGKGEGGINKPQRYLCAMVLPGALANAYEVNMWRQVVIDVTAMEAETLLEYDSATRYYYITT